MNITKSQLRNIIKEEIRVVLKETFAPQDNLKELISGVKNCIKDGGFGVIMKCGAIAARLWAAYTQDDWLAAYNAAKELLGCSALPSSCKQTLNGIIAALRSLDPSLPEY